MLFNVTLPVLLTLPEKVSVWPGETGCAGHTLVTLMPGVVISLQVADAVLVTMTPVHLSLPVAVTVLLTEQASRGAVKLAVKFAEAPGTSVATGMSGVFPLWLLITTILFKVMLPVFRTMPLEVTEPPGTSRASGQASVTTMPGVVTSGQVADAVFVTTTAVHLSLPVAITVLLTEQASRGAVTVTVKLLTAPGASVSGPMTGESDTILTR